MPWPRGRVLGGTSSINGMVYIRGQAADYDHWRQLGNTGWGWDDVLPLFRKSEDQERGAGDFHGTGGLEQHIKGLVRFDQYQRRRRNIAESGKLFMGGCVSRIDPAPHGLLDKRAEIIAHQNAVHGFTCRFLLVADCEDRW